MLHPQIKVKGHTSPFHWIEKSWLRVSVHALSPAADIISTVQFNHDGEFLATGDKGGRVVIFQRDGTKMRVSLSSGDLRLPGSKLLIIYPTVYCW